MYKVFTRTFWKENNKYPNGLEPHLGRKTILARVSTREQAITMCHGYNTTHKPGRLSRKAEFESV